MILVLRAWDYVWCLCCSWFVFVFPLLYNLDLWTSFGKNNCKKSNMTLVQAQYENKLFCTYSCSLFYCCYSLLLIKSFASGRIFKTDKTWTQQTRNSQFTFVYIYRRNWWFVTWAYPILKVNPMKTHCWLNLFFYSLSSMDLHKSWMNHSQQRERTTKQQIIMQRLIPCQRWQKYDARRARSLSIPPPILKKKSHEYAIYRLATVAMNKRKHKKLKETKIKFAICFS